MELCRASFSSHWRSCCAAILIALPAGAQPPAYKITDLGTLGGNSSRARAINDAGTVAGEAETKRGELHAFIWTAKDGMKDAGTPDGSISRANAINDRGVVAGEVCGADGVWLAFRWTAGAGMTNLPLPAGVSGARALAINHYGAIAGDGETAEGGIAVRWEMGAIAQLAPSGVVFSVARAINDDGIVAGQMSASATDLFASVAFIRGADSNAAVATLAAPARGGSSAAVAINRHGTAAGSAEFSEGITHAARFESGRATDLDTMNNAYSSANAINDSNDVVGVFFNGAGDDDRAFLWRGGTMFDLNELVEDGDEWAIVEACGINNRGEIAGCGVKDGREHAVLLSPLAGSRAPAISISLMKPANGAVFAEGAEIALAATARAEAGVKRVIFQADNETIGIATNEPFAFAWRGAPAGDHDLSAMAVTPRSEVRRSRPVHVRVAMANRPPEARIVRPAANGKIMAGQTNELAASADDADGRIAELRLFVDGRIVAVSNNTRRIDFGWLAPEGGAFEFRAEATDDAGCTVTSPVVRAEASK